MSVGLFPTNSRCHSPTRLDQGAYSAAHREVIMGSNCRAFKYAIFLLLMTFSEAYRVRTGEQTLVLTKAKTSIQASELLSRPSLSAQSGQIPKFFHQSWTSSQLTAEPNELSPSCRQMHWDWEWVYWTERDVLDLIRMYFPWFEGIYSIISNERHRANVAKYLYINVYGG